MNIDISKIKILPMTISILDKIANCLENDFDNFWTYKTLKDELSSENSFYFVAELEDEIIGFAGFKVICQEAELMNIVVRKSFRNNGISSLLMEHLLQELKDKKIATLHLEVAKNNIPAVGLYRKFNFKEVGLRKNYYQNDDAVLMSLNIFLD